eukprot:m.96636 g.96636  ORF g.96636 m.96636 type:complete len:306 (-) comp8639_c0_seq2:147-1064(-)
MRSAIRLGIIALIDIRLAPSDVGVPRVSGRGHCDRAAMVRPQEEDHRTVLARGRQHVVRSRGCIAWSTMREGGALRAIVKGSLWCDLGRVRDVDTGFRRIAIAGPSRAVGRRQSDGRRGLIVESVCVQSCHVLTCVVIDRHQPRRAGGALSQGNACRPRHVLRRGLPHRRVKGARVAGGSGRARWRCGLMLHVVHLRIPGWVAGKRSLGWRCLHGVGLKERSALAHLRGALTFTSQCCAIVHCRIPRLGSGFTPASTRVRLGPGRHWRLRSVHVVHHGIPRGPAPRRLDVVQWAPCCARAMSGLH